MIKGWKKLSRKDLTHLKEMKCNNTVLFQRTIDEHARLRLVSPGVEPCWDCRFIAKKLEMVGRG